MAKALSTSIYALLFAIVLGLLALGAFIWSGVYDIGADSRHTRPVHWALETMRERSIAARIDDLDPPDLSDRSRIIQGSGNYDAMCVACHLAPGMAETELSRGLYPPPPRLDEHRVGPARAFWVIKHGIKSTGMPAWGQSMDDPYIWNMAAFLQELPSLDAGTYRAMVAQSGGHSHGGGEAMGNGAATDAASRDHHAAGTATDGAGDHPHDPGTPADHHGSAAQAPRTVTHRHADGTVESHPAAVAPTPTGDAPKSKAQEADVHGDEDSDHDHRSDHEH
jgi:mono/diheme cytochrome c family protein